MYVEKCKNNGIEYLRLVESVYTPGVKGGRKRTLLNIGPLSRFDDGKPDFVQRVKDSFKACNPIIDSLIPFCEKEKPLETYKFEFLESDPFCIGEPKLFSHMLLERILDELGLIELFSSFKHHNNIEFDLVGFFRLLIYGRILNPASKIATAAQNDDYYQPIIDNLYEFNIYDTLDYVYKYQKNIFNKINKNMVSKFKRNTDLIFYDVTNFYFQIDGPDEDNLDFTSVRKNGVCKEERKLPIVQMGLFMDSDGFPVSIEIFPGNTLDHQTVIKSLSNTIDDMKFDRFIFVGDRGMCNYPNLLHLLKLGNGYIVSKSFIKSAQADKDWMTDEEGFISNDPGFKYKSRIIHKKAKDEFGNECDITEKEIVYWSKKYYDHQLYENKRFLNFIDKLMQSPSSFRVSSAQAKDLKKFIKKDCEHELTGELIDSSKLKIIIDMDKVNKFKKYFGYYRIVSSELKMNDKEIIDKYHKLSQIEDQFRVMKSSIDTRPIFVKTNEHINAHLIICFISLLVLRIIQYKIKTNPSFDSNEDLNWESGLSANRIIRALNEWTIDKLPGEYYRFNNINKPDLKHILDSFDINLPIKLYKRADLRSLKVNLKI